jgi:RNA polymerase primary sigma factor
MFATRRLRGSPTVELYLKDIHATPLLSSAGERELASRVALGDADARDHLVRANLRLVVNLAKGFVGRGVSYEDLIAEGNLGLIRASESYDGRDGVRFSSYAAHWIKQSIRFATIKQGRFIRLPLHAVTKLAKWRRAVAVLANELGREPTKAEIGEMLGLGEAKLRLVCQTLQASDLVAHGNSVGYKGLSGSDATPYQGLADGRERSPEDRLADTELEERILDRINHLESRLATVIRLRFGLNGDKPRTLREIGDTLGLTRERVRQLENHALAELARVGV